MDLSRESRSFGLSFLIKNTFIGTCSYESFSLGDLRGEIGYDLSKGYWG